MNSSYRQILRSSSIVGGASVINIVVSLVRTKVAALLLGPAGVGLIGLFTNLISTAAMVAGLGVGSVGTRQVAQAAAMEGSADIATVRRGLFWGTLALAALGAGLFWALRVPLASEVLQNPALAGSIGWLALAVALSIASASQTALLNGLRRIGDLARVSIWSAIVSTVFGILALWSWGREGVVAFVIAAPLASFLLGHWYVSRLPKVVPRRPVLRELLAQWKTLASLGLPFMVAGLAGTAGQLLVRMMVQRELGVDALGHFQAAWAVSMTYIGFVLSAMSTDYFPRLAAIAHDHEAVNRLVNEQTEVAMLLAAPILLVMLGLAPWVIELLYSRQFDEAVVVLRWQVMGDVLKIASWPLAYILVASGAGKTYMAAEWVAMGIFAALTFALLPVTGLAATGQSFLAMYVALMAIVLWWARRKTAFRWAKSVRRLLGAVAVAAVVLMTVASMAPTIGAVLAVAAAIGFGAFALLRLAHATDSGGRLGQVAHRTRQRLVRLGVLRSE